MNEMNEINRKLSTVKASKYYLHKKGKVYETIMLTLDTETLQTRVVYKEADVRSGIAWSRPFDLFTDGRFTEIRGCGTIRGVQPFMASREEKIKYFIIGFISAIMTLVLLMGIWGGYLAYMFRGHG